MLSMPGACLVVGSDRKIERNRTIHQILRVQILVREQVQVPGPEHTILIARSQEMGDVVWKRPRKSLRSVGRMRS